MDPIKTRTAIFFFDENEILNITMLEGAQVDYEDALDNALVMKKLTNNKPCLKLLDSTMSWSMNKKAKTFSAGKDIKEKTIARAILKGSAISSLLLNFFTSLVKSDVPTKMFTDRTEAYNWLMSFKK